MDLAAKIIYGVQAVWFTGAGVWYLYAAGSVSDGALQWFGVHAYLWVGVAHPVIGLAWWVLLLVRPDLLSEE